jgi:FdhD protein
MSQSAWLIRQGSQPLLERNELAREILVSVQIVRLANYMLLCTPLDLEAMAVGFAFSEGLLTGPSDIASVTTESTGFWSAMVRLELRNEQQREAVPRNLIVTSSCGLCGRQIEDGLMDRKAGSDLRIAAPQLIRLGDCLAEHQPLFERTGGTHAAGLFDRNGHLLDVAEDCGRHNALDKVIGKLLLTGRNLEGCGVIISGRISYELVVKSARAGLEVIAGVSAPSALAADAATLRNMTLCGFVRADRVTVYTHPFRITDLPECEH